MNVKLKRRFGQHFLRDRGTIHSIVRLIEPGPNDLILEIGSGDGALTRELLPAAGRLIAIELDVECQSSLYRLMKPYPNATLIAADILSLDIPRLLEEQAPWEGRVRVVGNLPYNIATAILERLLCLPTTLHDMICMVQLEAAERVVAKPGSRNAGYLSVWTQHRAAVELLQKVNPACFVPRPKVWSAILRLLPYRPWKATEYELCLIDLLKASFTHRRKTIANSLAYHAFFRQNAVEILEKAGIVSTTRPQNLSTAEFQRLAAAYLRGL